MTMPEHWLQTALAQGLGAALFHFLWEGALIALLLGGLLLLGRPFPARVRYTMACIALFAMPLAFSLTLLMLWPTSTADLVTVPLVRDQPFQSVPLLSGQELAESTKPLLQRLTDGATWFVPFWAAGVFLFNLYNLAGWMAAQRIRRVGVCLASTRWQERLNSLARRLRVSQPVKLLESCRVDVPVVIGFLKPVILVPAGLLAGCPPDQVELFLLHELAHVRRHDYAVNVVQRLVGSLFFYHPAAWWISKLVRAERENCCDDVVVAVSGNAHGYAAALTRLEQMRGAMWEPALAASGGNLKQRIERLLCQPGQPSTVAAPFLAAGLLAVSLGAALSALQTTPPVSESAAAIAAPQHVEMVAQASAGPPTPQEAPEAAAQKPFGVAASEREDRPAGLFDAGAFDPEAFDTKPLPATPTRAETDRGSPAKVASRKAIDETIGKAIGTASGKVIEKVFDTVGEKVGAVVADKVGTAVDAKLAKNGQKLDKKIDAKENGKIGGKVGGEMKGKVGNEDTSGTLIAQAQKGQTMRTPGPAPSPYAKWLNEDVAYIITNAEREVFERLRSDEQRQQFIERFWLRRDPTPGTAKNEFQDEHYRRIAFANARFPAQIPGWKTDRGRIYITFGPPDEIESHPSGGRLTDGSVSSADPFELWRYRYIEMAGAEGAFVFVDSNRTGEYPLLQSPIAQTRRGASAIGAVRQPSVGPLRGTPATVRETRLPAPAGTEQVERNVPVQLAEETLVPGTRVVYVVGAVRRAGVFGLKERDTVSVREVLSLSGGLKTEAAPESAKILRATGNSSRRLELPVNVRSILSGETGDVLLLPDDILFIPTGDGQNAGTGPAERNRNGNSGASV